MFRSFFTRLDCWLRDKPYPEPKFYAAEDVFESIFERDRHLRTRIYWRVRSFFTHHWLFHPYREIWRPIVWAYQRVTRGWDDRVAWSVDSHLDDMMPAVLRQLKRDKHGIPNEVFPTGPRYTRKDGNANKAGWNVATRRWNKILDQIIAGFEASARIKSHTYPELGPYPLRRPKTICKKCWKKIQDERFKKAQKLAKRDEKIFKRGMALFTEYYWSLWD